MEGLIHISELAWQRIDSPADLFKVGDKIKAEVISLEGAKIFLSAKKLMKDPWEEASAKYKVGQTVSGTILKVNPFGLFVKLDEDIHGLAHASQLSLNLNQKISELFNSGDKADFEIMSLEPKEHRLGLKLVKEGKEKKDKKIEKAEEKKTEKKAKKEEKEDKEKPAKKKTKIKERTEKSDK
jgi:ribosomal protein S1